MAGTIGHNPVGADAHIGPCTWYVFAEPFGGRNIIPRGDVGIAPYGGTVLPTAKLQFAGLSSETDP